MSQTDDKYIIPNCDKVPDHIIEKEIFIPVYENPYFKRSLEENKDDPYYGGDYYSNMQPWERRDW